MNVYFIKKCAVMLILIVITFYSANETAYRQDGKNQKNISDVLKKDPTFPRSRIVISGANSDLKATLDCLSRAADENRFEAAECLKKGRNFGRLRNNLEKSRL